MVDSIRAAIDLIVERHGSVTLALLCRVGAENPKWTLIFSSKWSDQIAIQSSTRTIIESLTTNLNAYELPFISNVKVLKTSDTFVKRFVTLYSQVKPGDSFQDISINDDIYSEVIVIRISNNLDNSSRLPRSRDPKLNRTINPIFNRAINPIFNRTINPIFNRAINPIFNRTINPIFNRAINPIFNRTINPIFNRAINPIFNRTINPIFNSTINPRVTLNPNVGFVYDNNLQSIYYIVDANEELSILYDLNNEWKFYAVKANDNIRLVYNRNNEWKFYFVKANNEVEILYSSDNQHSGFAILD